MLRDGVLPRVNGNETSLFKRLVGTPMVRLLGGIAQDDLVDPDFKPTWKTFYERGIMDNNLGFSSPVMWRYFAQRRMSVVPRSTSPPPATLFELLANVWGVIDYHKIRVSVIRIGSKPIVEYEQEAWRLQLFTAIYRLTPIDWKTSIDRGELFGGPGFIDLVIHNREASARWGIAMVYSRDDLREHVARFRPGGRYAALGLTDFCVLCFQHVTEEELEKDSLAQTDLASDLDVHPMVFVICYDVNVTSVLVWNAKGEKALRVENPAFNRGPVMYRGFSHP